MTTQQSRIEWLEAKVDQLGSNLERLRGEFSQMSERFTSLEDRIISLESSVNSRLNTLTLVVFGAAATGTTLLVTAIGLMVTILVRMG